MPYKNEDEKKLKRKLYYENNKHLWAEKHQKHKELMLIDPDYVEKHKAMRKKIYTKYYENHKEEYKERSLKRRPKYTAKKYGLTLDDYYKLYEKQNHLCAICEKDNNGVKNFNSLPLVIDHCHDKNYVRGLLCSQCNIALGMMRHSSKIALRAANYLIESEKYNDE